MMDDIQNETQPEKNLCEAMKGKIESMLEEVISDGSSPPNEKETLNENFDLTEFPNFFIEEIDEIDEDEFELENQEVDPKNLRASNKFSDSSKWDLINEIDKFCKANNLSDLPDSKRSTLDSVTRKYFSLQNKKDLQENTTWNYCLGIPPKKRPTLYDQQIHLQLLKSLKALKAGSESTKRRFSLNQPRQPSLNNLLHPIQDNLMHPIQPPVQSIINNQNLFQVNNIQNNPAPIAPIINTQQPIINTQQPIINTQQTPNVNINQNDKFVMPLRTFNFKHSYSKNQRHIPQTFQCYDESYNTYNSQNQNNIVVPLFKTKTTINKNISPFEQKCMKLESYLLAKKCFTREIFEEFKEDFIKLLKNQQTSRLCQYFFDGTNDEVVHSIFKEISEEIINLIIDPYANYFILKIFTHLDGSDRLTFLVKISKSLDWLSMNKISTYPIQIIIEKLSSRREQELILNSVKKSVIKLSLDIYGTHVIERIISNFPYDLIEPITFTISQNFLFLAKNPNGLCIIKKIIIVENKRKNHLIIQKSIEDNALLLVQDPYGNYALQTVLTYWNYEDCQGFIKSFKENFLLLSTQKYSSNVIEKCFELDPTFLSDFINEIFYSESALTLLLKNIFGNYVLQTVLKYVEDDETRNKIKKQIEMCLEKVHDNKIIYKWKKILNHYFPILN